MNSCVFFAKKAKTINPPMIIPNIIPTIIKITDTLILVVKRPKLI